MRETVPRSWEDTDPTTWLSGVRGDGRANSWRESQRKCVLGPPGPEVKPAGGTLRGEFRRQGTEIRERAVQGRQCLGGRMGQQQECVTVTNDW